MLAARTVDAHQLIKKWSSGFALGPLDFHTTGGETIAVFGKNGSGKSTLFQLLSGSIDRDDGSLQILGHKMNPDATTVRKRVGYLPQESVLPEWTTPQEILFYAARLLELDQAQQRVERELDRWDASTWRHRPISKASHGMQRRIGLAVAMIHNPDVLILDEPFNALDIVNSRVLEQAILSRKTAGQTTLLSLHSPLQAASLCDRAILLESGKLVAMDEWPSQSLLERTRSIEDRFFRSSPR